jgi:hypothetical protein
MAMTLEPHTHEYQGLTAIYNYKVALELSIISYPVL